jgi:hypothetical protein
MMPPALSSSNASNSRISAASRLHVHEHVLGDLIRQGINHVGGVVRIHGLEDISSLMDGQRSQDRSSLAWFKLGKELGNLLIGQPSNQGRHLRRREEGHDVCPICRTDSLRQTDDPFALPMGQQRSYFFE